MEKKFDSIISNGIPVVRASVLVKEYPSGAVAAIYSDNGITVKTNPIETDTNGYFEYYAADGNYSWQFSGDTIETRQIDGIMHDDPSDTDELGLLDSTEVTKGDALVAGKRSDTGAVAFTLHEYNENRTLSVETDFSPTADGVTDVSTELSQAHAAAIVRGSPRVLLEPGTYYAPNLTNYGDAHFVGSGKITGAFGLLGSPEDSGDGWVANDTNPAYNMRRFSTTDEPIVVLVGDSTATQVANALNYSATLSGRLERELKRKNPHKNITFYNRAIGGTSWAEFNSGPDGSAPYTVMDQYSHWYTNVNQDWLDYIEALSPDTLFIHFGMNDKWQFNSLAFVTALSKIALWTKVPDIVLCTTPQPQMNDPSNTISTKLEQNGRDMAAGMHRSYARYAGYGLLDFNRASNILVRGLDPCVSYLEQVVTAQSVTVNTVYEAASTNECRDYSFTATFASIPSDFWGDVPGGAIAPFKVRLSGQPSPPYPSTSYQNDLILWKDAGGNLFYNIRLRKEADGTTNTFLFAAGVDSGVVAPTSGTINLNVNIQESFLRVSLRGNFTTDFTETVVINRALPRFGGVFLPAFGYDGALSSRPSSATLTLQIGREKRNIPVLTSNEVWGTSLYPDANTQQPYGGNGYNHPTSIGASFIYGFVLEQANLFGCGTSISSYVNGGAVGVGTHQPYGVFHVKSGESGVATVSSKGVWGIYEGLNSVGHSFHTSNIGTAYPAVIGDTGSNEKAWLQYNHNVDAWEFDVDGSAIVRFGPKFSPTYSTSITFDSRKGDWFVITATDGVAFTINNPTNASGTQRITITIRNTSGGVLGAITWGAAFKMAAWTSPATANSRSIDFRYDGTNWIEIGRTAADIPN